MAAVDGAGAGARCRISTSLGAPLVGLAVLQIFSWYWLDKGGSDWSTGLPILLGLNAVATVVCLVWRRSVLKFDRSVAFSALALVALIAATSVLFISNFQDVATKGDHIEAASMKNPDIVVYAVISRFVHDHNLSQTGPIAGYSLGTFAHADVFGVFPFVDATATITGVGDWQALLPVIFVAMLLGVLALRDLANSLFPKSRTRAALVALVASAGFLYAFIQGYSFISQLLAMPIAVALGIMYFGTLEPNTKGSFFRSIAIVGLLDIILAFTYPHMLFLAQPVLVGAALIATFGPGWAVRARRLVVTAVAGAAVAAVVIPDRFSIAYSNVSTRANDTTSGFALPAFTPLQLLGFQRKLTVPPPQTTLLIQAAIVLAVVAGALVVLWRDQRRAAIFCVATVVLILASYGLVYIVRGRSYTQWKWISFFQPLYMALVILVVCAAAATLLRRVRIDATIRLVAGVVAGSVLMYFVVDDTRALTRHNSNWETVSTGLSTIEGNPALKGIDAVNVDLPPFWETMWAVYFLTPRTVFLLNTSEYATAPPRATWTLEPNSKPDPPGAIVRRLNSDYKLVRNAPAPG